MKLKHTKVVLASAALAFAVPATLVLSQDRSGQPQNDPGQRPQQQDRQTERLDGMQREQMSPEQSKQLVEKWFKNQASASQFEIEVARIALERLGTARSQPGMQGEQPRQPGAGGAQPGGDRTEPRNNLDQADQKTTGAQHDQLRQLAQTIERDHTEALKDLRQRAQQEGVEISESPELEPVHRAKLDEIRQKQGEEFVRAFVFGNMASHTYGILELNWAQNSAPSQQIKEFARATLPRIQQHAQQVAPLAYEIAGIQEARTAGERMEQRPGEQPPGQKPD